MFQDSSSELDISSPAVAELSACFSGGRQGGCKGLQFRMEFEDVKKGSCVSYCIAPAAVGDVEDGLAEGGLQEEDKDASSLINLLPERLAAALKPWRQQSRVPLIEVHIDEGRPAIAMFRDQSNILLPDSVQNLPDILDALASFSGREVSNLFGSDGRMALPGCLHRISRIQSPDGHIQGLTLRVGRHVGGVAAIFADILSELTTRRRSGLLLVGAPGLGKTTLLRDVVRALSDDFDWKSSVIVVDTSNEIAGDGNPPHSCIGYARRIMVGHRDRQAKVLREAVQNHTPRAVVVDEIGNMQGVAAACTISERGVVMVGTAHGTDMSSLLDNPELNRLLGGVRGVTVGDKLAMESGGKKTRVERKGSPVFDTLIEVVGQGQWRLHRDVRGSVDTMLGGGKCDTELRQYGPGGQMLVSFDTQHAARMAAAAAVGKPWLASRVKGTILAEAAGAAGVGDSTGAWLVELIQTAVQQGV